MNTRLFCQPSAPTGDRTTRFAQPLHYPIEVLFIADVQRRFLKGGILLGPALGPVRKQVGQKNSAVGTHPLERDLALVEQLHDCGPADSEQVGGLLSCQFQRPRSHSHRKPLLKRFNDLAEHTVDLGWKLDAVARGSSRQKISWRHRPSARPFMSLHEVVYLGDLPVSFWQVRLFIQSRRSHGPPSSKASYPISFLASIKCS
ncbi:hypothetical protein EV382_6279 [Micromonospora violae]|uniref:Uncharacterized protein n=1 Tax=Micromonospora violae TaxID=1278207 RepID=A0A4V6ME83_9ACTN|nr:hypothetical protein [Micromonospora violae]RZT82960.1 hypothetical protein EV382_6279 [Micromonospora violae]